MAGCYCNRSGTCAGCKLVAKQAKEAEARRQAKDAERLAWAEEHLIGQTVTGVAPAPEGIMLFFRDNAIWWRS